MSDRSVTSNEKTIERWMLSPGGELTTSAIIRYTGAWVRYDDHAREIKRLRAALLRINKWVGEFPPTGKTWEDGSPMSYGAAYGSNGERDYMRQIAHEALSGDSSADETRVSVAGDTLPTALWQFKRRAEMLLADEQTKANPDNALIGFICDAVRLARENERLAKSPVETAREPARMVDCGNPVMVNAEWFGPCTQPSGHDGECVRKRAENGKGDSNG